MSITPKSFWINYKDKSSKISIDPLRLYLSVGFLVNFILNLYIPQWLRKCSYLWCSDYWKMHLIHNLMQNLIETILLFSPPLPHVKLSPRFLQSPPRHREITHAPPSSHFFCIICVEYCNCSLVKRLLRKEEKLSIYIFHFNNRTVNKSINQAI